MIPATFPLNLGAWSLQLLVLAGAALLLPAVLGANLPALRLRLAQAALLAALALPLLQPVRSVDEAIRIPGVSIVVEADAAGADAPSYGHPAAFWLAAALAAGVLLRLGWLAFGVAGLARLRREADPLLHLPAGAEAAARRIGVRVPFLVSAGVGSPLTFGWRRPVVLVPESFRTLPAAEQEAIACHELLHVARKDARAVLFEEALCALLWFHPAVWALVDRIGLCREQLVDGAVVRLTGDRRGYLRALAAEAGRHATPAAVLPFRRRSHLVERVAQIRTEVPMSKKRISLVAAASAALFLAAGATAARAFPLVGTPGEERATAPKPPDPGAQAPVGTTAKGSPVYQVKGDVKEPTLVNRVNPAYPEEARKAGTQGKVVVEAVIGADGTVADAKVEQSPDETLSAAALDAVRKWTYKPATLKGKPVAVKMKITVAFRLQ